MDLRVLDFFVNLREAQPAWCERTVAMFSEISRPLIVLVVAVMGVMVFRNRRWLVLPVSILVVNVVVHMAKLVVDRGRPPAELWAVEVSTQSMPSGHAAAAVACAVVVSLLAKRGWIRALIWVWAVAVCLSRLYLGVHWPSDVIAGALIGAVVAGAAGSVTRQKVNKR